jgi:hypothetical protein
LNNNKLETRNTSTEAESKEEGGKGRQAGKQKNGKAASVLCVAVERF